MLTSHWAVMAAMFGLVSPGYCRSVSWCVDSESLRIGIATIAANELQNADLETGDTGTRLVQVYAGEGVDCGWLNGLQIIEPMPTYSLQRKLALSAKISDIARLSYLRGSAVLDSSLAGTVEHRVLRGVDILDLGGDLEGTSIIHVSELNWAGSRRRVQAFVSTGKPLTQELGRGIARAVAERLGFQPWYVNIRNDVYFVGRGYPMRYPFVDGDMPSVAAHKGTVTLKCLNKDGVFQCASVWE